MTKFNKFVKAFVFSKCYLYSPYKILFSKMLQEFFSKILYLDSINLLDLICIISVWFPTCCYAPHWGWGGGGQLQKRYYTFHCR